VLLLAIALLVVGVGVAFIPSREPSYHGKKLSEWVIQLAPSARGGLWDSNVEAEAAIRQIGSNAVPFLLKWVRFERPLSWVELHRKVDQLLESLNSTWKLNDSRYWLASGASKALSVLGPEAAGAIPDLASLLERPDGSLSAWQAA